jgi:hypothetical protein
MLSFSLLGTSFTPEHLLSILKKKNIKKINIKKIAFYNFDALNAHITKEVSLLINLNSTPRQCLAFS